MRTFGHAALAAIALLLVGSGAASAHTAYLLPQDFTPEGGTVTTDAAYATQFFSPTVPLGSSDFHFLFPDGTRGTFASVRIAQPSTTLDLNVSGNGTYLLSTGEMLGPVTPMVGIDGSWRPLGQGEAPVEGTPTTTLQTVAVAETYVTRGRPTEDVLDDTSGHLTLRPVSHPNRISVAEGFVVRLLFDGAPFPNMPLVLYKAGEPETMLDRAFVTDANGQATLTLDQPGNYIVAIRHRGPAAAGSQAQIASYTTSLTFEAFAVLPELPPEEPTETRRRPRRNRLQ